MSKIKDYFKKGIVLYSLITFSKYFYYFVLYDEILDLNKVNDNNEYINQKITTNHAKLDNNNNNQSNLDKLDLIIKFDNKEGNYRRENKLIEIYSNLLYNPCLTNKLFISSNLYGHELIRYYDY